MTRQGMSEFQQWLKEEIVRENADDDDHIYCPKVELASIDDSQGYGLFAKGCVRQNEVLIKIPGKFIITAQFIADIPEYADILKEFQLEPAEIMALFFVFENVYFIQRNSKESSNGDRYFAEASWKKPRGYEHFLKSRKERVIQEGSRADLFWWKSYVNVLPQQFGTPLFKHYLAENGDEWIKGLAMQLPQQIKPLMLGQLAELKTLEKKIFTILHSYKIPDIMSDDLPSTHLGKGENENGCANMGGDDYLAFWREVVCWAWHIVNTRCIYVDNLQYHPLVDARMNSDDAKRLPNRRFSNKKGNGVDCADYGGSLALIPLVDMLNHRPQCQCIPMFDRKSNSYIVRAEHHAVMDGQQLFVCYGAHDNAKLWIEYGFRMDENPFNRVNIPIELFIALAERCGTRVSSIKREILTKADLPCTIYATDNFPSYALRKNCSILLLPKEKLTDWSQHIFSPPDEDQFEEESEERRLLKAILERLEDALIVRREKCVEEDIRPFWTDQIHILQKMMEILA